MKFVKGDRVLVKENNGVEEVGVFDKYQVIDGEETEFCIINIGGITNQKRITEAKCLEKLEVMND